MLPAVSIIPVIHLEIQSPDRVRLFSHSKMTADHAFDSIVTAADSNVAGLQDLPGKKIGVFPGTSARNLLKFFLTKQGVDTGAIQFIELAPPTQLPSLKAGAIDALYSYEPITTAANASGCKTLFGSVYAALQPQTPFGVSVISRRYEKEHSAGAAGAIGAVDEAVAFMNEHPQDVRQLLPKYLKLDPAIAEKVNVVNVTSSKQIDAASLQRFIDLLHEAGEIPERIDAHRLID
jgi:ABC-type nitrate/sulfonate/bicarbonate transport system substrate-binding protein